MRALWGHTSHPVKMGELSLEHILIVLVIALKDIGAGALRLTPHSVDFFDAEAPPAKAGSCKAWAPTVASAVTLLSQARPRLW